MEMSSLMWKAPPQRSTSGSMSLGLQHSMPMVRDCQVACPFYRIATAGVSPRQAWALVLVGAASTGGELSLPVVLLIMADMRLHT